MNWMIRVFASAALKQAVAVAYDVLGVAANAIAGVLQGDSVSDSARSRLAVVLRAIVVLRDFIGKLADIMGVNLLNITVSGVSELESALDKLQDLAKKL